MKLDIWSPISFEFNMLAAVSSNIVSFCLKLFFNIYYRKVFLLSEVARGI